MLYFSFYPCIYRVVLCLSLFLLVLFILAWNVCCIALFYCISVFVYRMSLFLIWLVAGPYNILCTVEYYWWYFFPGMFFFLLFSISCWIEVLWMLKKIMQTFFFTFYYHIHSTIFNNIFSFIMSQRSNYLIEEALFQTKWRHRCINWYNI